MNPNQLKQLEKLAKVFNTDNVITPEDIAQVVEGIAQIIKVERENIKGISEEHKQTLQSVIETVSNEHDKILKEVKNTSQNAISEATEATTKALQEVKRIAKEVMEMKPKDGEKGKDADEEKIIEEVLAKIKLPEYDAFSLEEKGEDIVYEINSLPTNGDEYKIDASHIKNLPTPIIQGSNISKSIYQLEDVKLSSLANNDVLKYNSTTKQWENGVGGGGATAFTDLTDVPSSYSGQAGKAVRVNVGETGLEFFTASGTGTVTSVAATVPTGLTISGSPITAAGTLAIGLDTGYVIPLQSTIDGKVPYTGATGNVDLGIYSLITDKITSKTSSGLILENNGGGDVLHIGNGGGVNATAYGGWNFDGATANTIAIFGASKTLSSADTATYPSLTELSYVKGVTSAIQTQLNAKVDDGAVTTSGLTMATSRILGRTTAATGAIEELTAGSSLLLSAGSLNTIQDIRTTANPQFATIELGAATDTTLSRVSAGVIAVEGVTVATASNTLTLSGKTLTEPKFVDGGFIADANGNEMIIFDTVASAVNEVTLANAATGANPKLSATGGDTNIGIDIQTKGTGVVNILGNSTQAGEVRIFEDTDNGTNYTGFKAPATLAGNVVYTLPTADGTSGQVLSTNASGVLSWVTAGSAAFSGCRVYKASGQSIGTTLTVLTFDTESYDTDTYHDNTTNNSRITIPSTGYYRITGLVTTGANAIARCAFRVDGTTQIAVVGVGNAGASTANGTVLVTDYYLTSGQYVELLGAFGTTQTTSAGIDGTLFMIQKIG